MLSELAANVSMRLGVVQLAAQYATRGDAHIEHLEMSLTTFRTHLGRSDGVARFNRSKLGVDCLHFCAAPGVLDGLARGVLGRLTYK
jgi:hypothetical protein